MSEFRIFCIGGAFGIGFEVVIIAVTHTTGLGAPIMGILCWLLWGSIAVAVHGKKHP